MSSKLPSVSAESLTSQDPSTYFTHYLELLGFWFYFMIWIVVC